MFKLIKINNVGVNVPEPISLKKDANTILGPAAALVINASGNAANCGETTKPKYISIKGAGKGETRILAYEITPNMVFLTKLIGEAETLKVGNKVTLCSDENGFTSFVSSTTTSGVATIYDLSEASGAGSNIAVKFE